MIQGFVKIPFTHFKRRDVCVVDGQYMHQFVVLCVYQTVQTNGNDRLMYLPLSPVVH